jgi:two-component system sensor histidine kinase DesK
VIAVTRQDGNMPDWVVQRAPLVLVTLHLPFIAVAPIFTVIGLIEGAERDLGLAIGAAAVVGALQIRHSLAAARGTRPTWWGLTFLLVVAATYLPMLRFTWNWISMQWFVLASASMLLPSTLAVPAVVVPAIGTLFVSAVTVSAVDEGTPLQVVLTSAYNLAALLAGAAALWGSARLVFIIRQLYQARAELAQQAADAERSRLSRDLHDLLGQTLSAVSLKGDLALRLLPKDPEGARIEIESLSEVARDTLRNVRAVTRHEHVVSLAQQVRAAKELLASAGVHADVRMEPPPLPASVEEALAWALREAVTNILRHSQAEMCSISLVVRNGRLCLRVENDRASSRDSDEGTGLRGMQTRARDLGGTTSIERRGDRFVLTMMIPETHP